jgi:hypothetical protein
MTFQVNGAQGKYDGVITDNSVRYGRNAVNNHLKFMDNVIVNNNQNTAPILDFRPTEDAFNKNTEALDSFMDDNDTYLSSLNQVDYEYRYMPEKPAGEIDKKSLLGAAYEEMGKTKELPVGEFEYRYLLSNNMTAKPLDINNDGKITNAEYATTILASDMLSKGTEDPNQINGVVTPKGMTAVLEYAKKSNAEAATKLYSNLYKQYDLGSEEIET